MSESGEPLRENLLRRYPSSRLQQITLSPEDRERTLPADYVAFLASVGSGSIGDGRYMFYAGPLDPDEVLESEVAVRLHDVFIVGDNFAGDFLAYAFRQGVWTLFEIDHTSPAIIEPGHWKDIFEFVEERFLRHQS